MFFDIIYLPLGFVQILLFLFLMTDLNRTADIRDFLAEQLNIFSGAKALLYLLCFLFL